MSITQVSICNSALIKVGADRISSITQQTKSAILLNSIYEQIRDAVLRDHPWHFATKRVTLAPVSTTPVWGFDFAYDLPSDYLKIQGTDIEDLEYIIENGQILCDEETLNVKYTFRNTDESLWTPDFSEAFAWRLGGEISYALMQSIPLRDQCMKIYSSLLSIARSISGSEGIISGLIADTWTKSRR